ncbi:MAG TPA: HD domain-containing phosphohydrolase [Acidimicrobiales bacterium]|nr:HD domain-containing phosphohydrolase [Acidimicrobiales bacterium]
MRRSLEIFTAITALAVVGAAALTSEPPRLIVVLTFGAMIVLAENVSVLVHRAGAAGGTSLTPGFMLTMAAIAVFGDDPSTVVGAALVGAFEGLYIPHLRQRDIGIVAFNCGQFALSSAAAALVFTSISATGGWEQVAAATAAAVAYGVVNVSFVLPYVALKHGERASAVWADMFPALPNYIAWGLLGLLVGLVCAELGPLAIVLLVIPMGIGRWTFSSFSRVKDAHDRSVELFIRLIEAKDPYTAGHTERVARYSLYIGEELGLSPSRLEHLRQSALMHDVGKLAVPSRLLNKPGRLTPEEWDVVKRHNSAGIDIVANVDFMRTMAVVASDEHGRYDATPSVTTPPELVLEAHIVAVADAFDAMTSTRAYRRALEHDVAVDELRANAGTQFNPACVDALVAALDRRGERHGAGHETEVHQFAVTPPVAGVGSAGLGDLEVAR